MNTRWLERIAAWLPLVALIAIAVGPALVGARIFLAGDLIETTAPWVYGTSVDGVVNQCVGDTVDSATPTALAFREGIASGQGWPDFSTMASAGTVLGGNPSSGVVSPIFLATLPFSDTTFTAWIKVFEVAVAVAGTVAWARRIGLSSAAGAVGGFLFVTSGYLLMWTNWPQTRTAAFFPLLFWALERIIQDRTVRSALPLPLIVASLAVGGFPAIVVHAAYLAAAYALVRLIVVNRQRAAEGAASAGNGVESGVFRWLSAPLLALGGGVLAVGMVAWQLVPWAQQLAAQDLTHRADWWADTIEPQWLLTTMYAQGLGTCSTSSLSWGGQTIPVESVSFIGAGTLVLIAVALVHRTRAARGVIAVLLVGGLLSLAVTFVGGIFNEAVHLLPGMSGSRMWRTRAVGGMAFAMLAAVGFDALLAGERPQGWRRRVALGAALASPLLLGFAALTVRSLSTSPEGWVVVRPSVLLSLASGSLVALVWLAVLLAREKRAALAAGLAALLIPVCVAAEGVVTAKYWWPLAPADSLYRETPASRWLVDNTGDHRIASVRTAFQISGATVVGLRTLTGHTFVPPDWAALIEQADPGIFHGDARTYVAMSNIGYLGSPVMDRLAVRYAIQDPIFPLVGEDPAFTGTAPQDGLRLVDPQLTPGLTVYENTDVLPRFRWANAARECVSVKHCAELMADTPPTTVLASPQTIASVPFGEEVFGNDAAGDDTARADLEVVTDLGEEQVVRVDAEAAGMLVVADAVQTGWSAYLDGEPAKLHTVDGALRGVAVPEGSHEVRLAYEPTGRDNLLPIAGLSGGLWVFAALGVVFGVASRRRREARRELR